MKDEQDYISKYRARKASFSSVSGFIKTRVVYPAFVTSRSPVTTLDWEHMSKMYYTEGFA